MANFDLHSYDHYLVMFSGGKDSTALVLTLLNSGIPKEKIELWHHDVDGIGNPPIYLQNHPETFMDWEVTQAYCLAFAKAFRLPIYFSWKEGGFEREMNRTEQLTAPIYFEYPNPISPRHILVGQTGGKTGKMGTRRKFPQVSANLSVRWCSAYLKIDVGTAAIRNQERFNGKRTLVLSGERGQESPARAKYAEFEPDRADSRAGKKSRLVDRYRPLIRWSEQDVWEIIEWNRVRVHPAYYLGFNRVSCKFCIFGNANQFASAFAISPDQGQNLLEYEQEFGVTIKPGITLADLVAKGTPYDMEQAMIDTATAYVYDQDIFMDEWHLPKGAYGEGCGPT